MRRSGYAVKASLSPDSRVDTQHHFHEDEVGMPAPFVFLAQVAVQTKRIRLGTGIVILPLELPIRVAEDAAVLDLTCGGRLEVGIGPGGNLSAYRAFDSCHGHSAARPASLRATRCLGGATAARRGQALSTQPQLVDRVW